MDNDTCPECSGQLETKDDRTKECTECSYYTPWVEE
jgi:hypothetical protein